jgi:hypothetical protein
LHAAVVACIGDETHKPQLQVLGLEGDRRWSIDLPGRPRWCVIDAKAERVFLAIREPSMVLVARLPDLTAVQHWLLPSGGAHGMDINHGADRLYVACDGGLLVEVDARSGQMRREWPLAGVPDATFFNPRATRLGPRPKVGQPPLPEKGIQNGRSKGMRRHRQN